METKFGVPLPDHLVPLNLDTIQASPLETPTPTQPHPRPRPLKLNLPLASVELRLREAQPLRQTLPLVIPHPPLHLACSEELPQLRRGHLAGSPGSELRRRVGLGVHRRQERPNRLSLVDLEARPRLLNPQLLLQHRGRVSSEHQRPGRPLPLLQVDYLERVQLGEDFSVLNPLLPLLLPVSLALNLQQAPPPPLPLLNRRATCSELPPNPVSLVRPLLLPLLLRLQVPTPPLLPHLPEVCSGLRVGNEGLRTMGILQVRKLELLVEDSLVGLEVRGLSELKHRHKHRKKRWHRLPLLLQPLEGLGNPPSLRLGQSGCIVSQSVCRRDADQADFYYGCSVRRLWLLPPLLLLREDSASVTPLPIQVLPREYLILSLYLISFVY